MGREKPKLKRGKLEGEKQFFTLCTSRKEQKKIKRGKRDKKQIVQGAGHTDGAIMQRFVASADKKLKYPMYLLNINTKKNAKENALNI